VRGRHAPPRRTPAPNPRTRPRCLRAPGLSPGVARGTFYLYFHDKRSIFEELLSGFFQKIAMSVVRIHTDRPLEPQVVENVTRVVDLFLNDPHMAKILLADAVGIDPDFDRRLLAFYSDVTGLLEESLKEGQSVGIVREGDARVATHFVIGGLKEVLLQFARAKVPVDRAAVVREIYLLLRLGVLRERETPPKKKAAPKSKTRATKR
jgi:AcrR family transcriptional regulator